MAEALLAESVPATLESRCYCTNLLLLPTHPATGFPLAKLYDSSRLQKNENAPENSGNCRVAEGSLKHSFFSRLRPTTSQCRRPQPQNDKDHCFHFRHPIAQGCPRCLPLPQSPREAFDGHGDGDQPCSRSRVRLSFGQPAQDGGGVSVLVIFREASMVMLPLLSGRRAHIQWGFKLRNYTNQSGFA